MEKKHHFATLSLETPLNDRARSETTRKCKHVRSEFDEGSEHNNILPEMFTSESTDSKKSDIKSNCLGSP